MSDSYRNRAAHVRSHMCWIRGVSSIPKCSESIVASYNPLLPRCLIHSCRSQIVSTSPPPPYIFCSTHFIIPGDVLNVLKSYIGWNTVTAFCTLKPHLHLYKHMKTPWLQHCSRILKHVFVTIPACTIWISLSSYSCLSTTTTKSVSSPLFSPMWFHHF